PDDLLALVLVDCRIFDSIGKLLECLLALSMRKHDACRKITGRTGFDAPRKRFDLRRRIPVFGCLLAFNESTFLRICVLDTTYSGDCSKAEKLPCWSALK